MQKYSFYDKFLTIIYIIILTVPFLKKLNEFKASGLELKAVARVERVLTYLLLNL